MNVTKMKLAILALLAAIVLSCRFLFPTGTAIFLVARWGYWIMLAGVGVYAFLLTGFIRQKLGPVFFRSHWVGLLISVLGTLFINVHEPHQFKVLYDEFVISGVARNMHFMREATFPIKAHNVKDELEVLDATIDKRPFFFPFVLSCLHDISGYRPENVFVLNGITTFLLLFLTYCLGVLYGGKRLGLACVTLWLGLPLLAQGATSGGYDVFNLLMLMLFWLFGREYIRSGSIASQNLFVLTTVYLAQVRYESILMVVPMAFIFLVSWRRQRRCELGWVAVCSPLCLLLPLLINMIFMRVPAFMQTDPGQTFFSIDYFQGNMERAIWYLFNVNFSATNSAVLSFLGVISIVAFFVKMGGAWRRLLAEGDDVILLLMGVVVLLNFGLVLCNFWGQLDDPTASRFSLPLHLIFICCFAWVVREWRLKRPMPVWLVAVGVGAIVLAVPSAARNAATRVLMQGRELTWFIEQLDLPEHRGALVISQPIGPILYNHPAVAMEIAEENKWKINECLKERIYPEILVLELWSKDYKTGEEIPYGKDLSLDIKKGALIGDKNTALSSAFKKVKVAETRLRPTVVARIYRIVDVEVPGTQPSEEALKEKYPFKNIGSYHRHFYSILP